MIAAMIEKLRRHGLVWGLVLAGAANHVVAAQSAPSWALSLATTTYALIVAVGLMLREARS